MIDYRDLLKRYIDHVGECEGVTFISHINVPAAGRRVIHFTDEEVSELEAIEEELQASRKGHS